MKSKFVKLSICIALALVIYYLIKDVFSTVLGAILGGSIPLLISIAVSYLMYQTIRLIELLLRQIGMKNPKWIRAMSIIITIVITICSIVFALYLTIPAIITNLEHLIANLPTIQLRAVEILDEILSSIPFLNEISAESLVKDLLGAISNSLPLVYNMLLALIESTAEGILILSLIIMMCIMILYEKQ